MSDPGYDIFLSYNSRDRTAVEQVALQLRRDGFTPWLDAWDLPAGGDWQDGIDHGLRHSRGCAVFLGPHGFGDWQLQEMKVASSMAAHDPAFRFFLVLLPGAPDPLDSASLPAFINLRGRINLREGYTAPRQFQHLTNAILGVAMGPSGPAAPDLAESPYRGLEPFDATHAEFFFGRNAEIRKLLDKLRAAPFLAVIGPSGSGKSSLVLAGLIPALQNGQLPGSAAWPIVTMVPGPHPVESLAVALDTLDPQRSRNQLLDELQGSPQGLRLEAAALLRVRPRDARLVLVVDQFEEIFTLCRDETERETFLNLLLAAAQPDGPCLVVITMRADFYPRVTEYPALAAEVESHQLLVGALTREGLTAAIEQPAFRKGLQFEPGLVSTILADMGGDAGALPLLQYALDELWKRQHGGLLTLEGYRASGGVGDAIATRANAVFESLTPEQQAVARRILLRLTQPGEATEDTRRRAELDELVTGEAERPTIEAAVNAMVAARLLTASRDDLTGAPQVDVAHEALIRAWPRLRQWLDEDRQGLLVHRRLTEAAQEWQRTDRDPDLLYRSSRLAEAAAFSRLQPDALNERERTFLAESTVLREREQAAAAEAAAGRERLRRRIVSGLGAFSAVALLLALLAGWQWREAGQQTNEALRQTGIAQEQAAAARTAEDEAQRQALVASNAEATAQAEADRASQQAAVASTAQVEAQQQAAVASTAQVEAQQQAAVASTAQVEAQQQAAAAATAEVAAQNQAQVALSRQLLVQSSADLGDPSLNLLLGTEAFMLNPDDLNLQRALFSTAWGRPNLRGYLHGQDAEGSAIAFSPDGSLMATGNASSRTYLWNTETLQPAAPPMETDASGVWRLMFSPDARWLVIGTFDGAVYIWDIRHHRLARKLAAPADAPLFAPTFSPDSRMLATGDDTGTIYLWSVPQFQLAGKAMHGEDAVISNLAFIPEEPLLVSGDRDGNINVWNIRTRTALQDPLLTGQDDILKIAVSPDGSTVYELSELGELLIWDIVSQTLIGAPTLDNETPITSFSLSTDGSTLAAGSDSGIIRIWDLEDGPRVQRDLEAGLGPGQYLALNADGALLASSGISGTVALWAREDASPNFLPLIGMQGGPASLAFSPTGDLMATGSETGEVILWSQTSGAQLGMPLQRERESFSQAGRTPDIYALAFSPDGKLLVTGSLDGVMHVWDVATRTERWQRRYPFDGAAIFKLRFSPDGAMIAGASGDGSVRLWRLDDPSFEQVLSVDTPQDMVMDVAFNPAGTILADMTDRGDIQLWDLATFTRLVSIPTAGDLQAAAQLPPALTFIGDGDQLAATSLDGEVRYWRVPDGTLVNAFPVAEDAYLASLESSPDRRYLAGISSHGDVYLWDATTANPEIEQVDQTITRPVTFTPDGNHLAFFGNTDLFDGVVVEVDLATDSRSAEHPAVGDLVDMQISRDGSIIVGASATGVFTAWDTADEQVRFSRQVPASDGMLWQLAISDDEQLIATGGSSGQVRIWDGTTGKPTDLTQKINGPVAGLAFDADGGRLAVSSEMGALLIWDLATGRTIPAPPAVIAPASGGNSYVAAPAFAPDDELLAFRSGSGIGIWRIGDQALLQQPDTTPDAHLGWIAFSPDGASLAYALGQNAIAVWDVAHDSATAPYLVNSIAVINPFAFSPDGQTLAAPTTDGVVLWRTGNPDPLGAFPSGVVAGVAYLPSEQLITVDFVGHLSTWPVAPSAWQQHACQLANRNLTREEWERFIGDPDDPHRPYHKTCPQFPAATTGAVSPAGSATPVPAGAAA